MMASKNPSGWMRSAGQGALPSSNTTATSLASGRKARIARRFSPATSTVCGPRTRNGSPCLARRMLSTSSANVSPAVPGSLGFAPAAVSSCAARKISAKSFAFDKLAPSLGRTDHCTGQAIQRAAICEGLVGRAALVRAGCGALSAATALLGDAFDLLDMVEIVPGKHRGHPRDCFLAALGVLAEVAPLPPGQRFQQRQVALAQHRKHPQRFLRVLPRVV